MRIHLATFLLLSCLAVPATAAKRALPETPFAATQPVEIILTQQELAVDVPDGTAATAQYGLLGALIGTAITNAQVKNGEQRVGQLRDLLLDYPFNARIEAALRRKLANAGITGPAGIKVLHTTWDAADPAAAATAGEAILLTPRYSIFNNFELLSVKLALGHVERTATPGRKPRQKVLHGRSYSFNFPLSKVSGSGADEDALRWVGFGREPLETLLDLGVEQVTDMLVYDLSADGRAEAVLPIRGEKGHVGGSSFAGRVVREGDAWLWLRTGAGVMRTLAGQYPVSESTIAALPPRPIPAPAAVPVPPADDDAATAEPILSADPATPAPEHEADPAADLE